MLSFSDSTAPAASRSPVLLLLLVVLASIRSRREAAMSEPSSAIVSRDR